MAVSLIAYDTETTSLRRNSPEGAIFSFSTCDEAERVRVQRLDGSPSRIAMGRVALERLWNDTSIEKTIHNAKFDVGFTMKHLGKSEDEMRKHTIHCTMLASKVLRNDHPSHALKELCWELAGIPVDDERAIKGYGNYQHVPEHLMTEYQKRDAIRGMLLALFFLPKLKAEGLYEIYRSEVDVIWPTISMENRGVMLNVPSCNALISNLRTQVTTVLDEVEQFSGQRLKLGSPEVVKDLLFNKLHLTPKKDKKRKEGTTNKDVLLELRESQPHPMLDAVIKYRSFTRGITTLRSYLDLADEEGVIHPNISTCQAITGRESCSDPNLQNVQKDKALKNPFPIPARKAFRPRPGYVNFHIDYSGQEARLLVHYSGDQVMVDIMNGGGPPEFKGKPHALSATLFYGKRFSDAKWKGSEWQMLYDAAKNGFFAKAYGAQWSKLGTTLQLTPQETVSAAHRFESTLPKLCVMMLDVQKEISKNGKIYTAFGRPLYIPRNHAYMGVNYLIQGTAAEMMKRAQIRVHDYIRKATSGEVALLLPIHDEIIFEFPRKRLTEAPEVIKNIIHLMTDFPGRFKVPMEAEVSIATTDWMHKTEWKGWQVA